jgi:hypothetical protein
MHPMQHRIDLHLKNHQGSLFIDVDKSALLEVRVFPDRPPRGVFRHRHRYSFAISLNIDALRGMLPTDFKPNVTQ